MKTSSTSRFRYFLFERKEKLLSLFLVRWMWLLVALLRFFYHTTWSKDYYRALEALLRYERDISCLVGVNKLGKIYIFISKKYMKYAIRSDNDLVLSSFVSSERAQICRDLFISFGADHLVRMKYPKKNLNDPGRQGDLIVLKPYIGPQEKGVLFIQYDEGVQRFASLFVIEKLAQYYRFVIEPSTSGYQNSMFFLCLGLNTEVIIEAQYEPDYEYIKGIGNSFNPIRLGAGDWADPALFQDGTDVPKEYDVVMIANWLSWKRHDLFFKSLASIRTHINKVAVIGYPIEGRTLNDVKKECSKYGVDDLVDFFERIPPKQVGEILRKSKTGILLSKDEGANRGIYECFFSGVPIILTSENRGVNRDHVNGMVGLIASDTELPNVIVKMVNEYQSFSPREWALKNTGYVNSTRKLNTYLKELSLAAGEEWTSDIFTKHNSPHARFAYPEEQRQADEAVTHLTSFLRGEAKE